MAVPMRRHANLRGFGKAAAAQGAESRPGLLGSLPSFLQGGIKCRTLTLCRRWNTAQTGCRGAHALQALVQLARRADLAGPAAGEAGDQLRERRPPQHRRTGPESATHKVNC